jgi:Ni/Co efflux regulator RcnB
LAALTLSLPVLAHAGENRHERDGREQHNEAPAQQHQAPAPKNQAGPRAGFGRADANAARRGAPNAARERARGAPNTAQAAPNPQPPNPQPNVARERGRGSFRGAPNVAQGAPRQGAPAGNFAENRDRGRDFRNGGGNDGRDFRNDRGGGRSFSFRGRQYAAVRAPAFRYPRGWGYHHWDRGQFLPSVFLAAPFYFDYDWLGLPPPPPGARWVRNGPDALLVSVYDDRILDVIYDAFY